jgi:TPR repeat protein
MRGIRVDVSCPQTQDPDLQFEFAVFMVDASKTLPVPDGSGGNVMAVEKALAKRDDLVREAVALLKRLADRGHGAAQYFLADCYANGLGTARGKQDFERAYPLFVLAAKHGHPDAAYRAVRAARTAGAAGASRPRRSRSSRRPRRRATRARSTGWASRS